jgi:hypothetical protein
MDNSALACRIGANATCHDPLTVRAVSKTVACALGTKRRCERECQQRDRYASQGLAKMADLVFSSKWAAVYSLR